MMKRRRSVLLQRLDAIGPMFSSAADVMQIVRPSESDLPSYITALKRGWSPVPQLPNAAENELARVRADSEGFIARMDDLEAKGHP